MQGNLLIVDDEPFLSDSLQYLLRNICEKVFVATNGEEAITILSENKIHCVLSDFHMPVMCGLELFKKVRLTDEALPFIFYTGHGIESIQAQLTDFKNFEVILKPSFDKLPDLVKKFIGRTY